ncbi:hypothetical protein Tco_1283725 [Tanacetum coccineum]
MEKAATTASSLEAEQDSGSCPRCQDTILGDMDAQTRHQLVLPVQVPVAVDDFINTSIQALIDKKKVIIKESSIKSDFHLEDAEGTDCLPTATIFKELARMGAKSTAWNEFSSIMASLIICLPTNQKFNLSKYIFDAMVKHLDEGVQIYEKSRRKQRKEAEVAQDETAYEEGVPTPSNDPLPNGEDSMQLNDLMVLYNKLQKQVLDLENAKSDQAVSLKKRVEKLERRIKFRTIRLQRLKKGRRIEDIDDDAEVTLTQERHDEDLMFDAGVLDGDEMFVDDTKIKKEEQSTKIDEVTTIGDEDDVAPTIPVSSATSVEETLAQTLMEIKAAKPKAKGIVFHDQEKQVSMAKPAVSVT